MRVVRVSSHNKWNALGDINPGFRQNLYLSWIIGQQPDFMHAQQFEHIRTNRKIALVGSKAQLIVRLYRVVAFILQGIGPDFVQQTDIASFLTMVKQDPTPLFRDLRQRGFQLKTAVAAQAEESTGLLSEISP